MLFVCTMWVTHYSVCTMLVLTTSDSFGMTIIVFSHPTPSSSLATQHDLSCCTVYEHRLESVESKAIHSSHMVGLVLSRRMGHTIPTAVAVWLPIVSLNVTCLPWHVGTHLVRMCDDGRALPRSRGTQQLEIPHLRSRGTQQLEIPHNSSIL
jgi:hypothetical protein